MPFKLCYCSLIIAIVDGLSHNKSWEAEHGVDGSLVMVSVFSACGPITLEKYLMKCQFISFGRKP